MTLTTTNHLINIMKEYYKEMEIFDYEGQEWQVVSVRNINPHSVGEDEILYTAQNLHGYVKDIMDWELLKYRMEAAKCSA